MVLIPSVEFYLLHKHIYLILDIARLKKERYLIRQDNIIHKFSMKLSFSSIGQEISKHQKQEISKQQKEIGKLLILTKMAA